jgi:2-phosphosulfolactate phosphatase
MPEASAIAVHLLPALLPPGALRGGIAVVVDVLRASTMIVHALSAGCEAVLPCAEIDEARAVAQAFPSGQALLGGERHGVPIEGFDLGNSPRSCTQERCAGKSLVFTTTNGTRAILAGLDADRLVVGSFANLGATVALLIQEARPAHIVCSGTEGEISFEDVLLAGALVAQLSLFRKGGRTNDSAEIAARLWHERQRENRPLADLIAIGRGGRRVTELGLRDDIEAAAEIDRYPLIAELQRGPAEAGRAPDWHRPLRIVARR